MKKLLSVLLLLVLGNTSRKTGSGPCYKAELGPKKSAGPQTSVFFFLLVTKPPILEGKLILTDKES